MARRNRGRTTITYLNLACYAIAIAALVLAIVAFVRVDEVRTTAIAAGPSMSIPVFRIENNMITLNDGTVCVESAGLPPGKKPLKSKATRLEGRFKMIRVADLKTLDEGPEIQNVSCVPPIVEGARWRQPFEVIIDPTNSDGISRDLIVNHLWRGANEWESRLSQTVMTGQDTSGCVDGFDNDSPDGKNEVMFGFIEEPSVLAITVLWGIFGGPLNEREILESDIMFNLHFDWGNAAANSNVHGIWNIGSHEFGHKYGMGHSPGTSSSTMHPTAVAGETKKRDILQCEADALCELYGDNGPCAANTDTHLQPFIDVGTQSRCGVFPSGPNDASAVGAGTVMSIACMMVAVMT